MSSSKAINVGRLRRLTAPVPDHAELHGYLHSWGMTVQAEWVEDDQMSSAKGRVLSLCDFTGNMVAPWIEAGYEATIVDKQHPNGSQSDGLLTRVGADVCYLHNFGIDPADFDIVFAFPPCTDLAQSGARWFREKGLRSLIESLTVVEACRALCERSGAPWMLENPVGQLSTYWRKPDYLFDPCDYGDPYTKRTCLWTGGGFVIPVRQDGPSLLRQHSQEAVEPTEGSKMHLMSPSADRANLRSATPMGFARAVFEVNRSAEATAC